MTRNNKYQINRAPYQAAKKERDAKLHPFPIFKSALIYFCSRVSSFALTSSYSFVIFSL